MKPLDTWNTSDRCSRSKRASDICILSSHTNIVISAITGVTQRSVATVSFDFVRKDSRAQCITVGELKILILKMDYNSIRSLRND